VSLRTRLLSVAERVRSIPGRLDVRQNVVTVRVREWSGQSSGEGVFTDTDTDLHILTSYNIRVQEVSTKDIVASGGQLTQQDLKVGPFTPGFILDDTIDPPTNHLPREILFRVTGRGMPTGGRWFRRYDADDMKNFSAFLFLKATGDLP